MADPLSITASAVGIIVPALHGTRLLLEDLQQLKDAPKMVKRLVEDVHSVDTALKLLQSVEEREWELLGTGIAWQDRANVGFFKQGQIKVMSEQLSNCKLTINSVVSIATLYSSVRHSHVTEEIKKAISIKQAEVKGAITTADRQLVVLENKLEELNLNSDDDDAAGSSEGKTEALRQLEEELKGVKASQKLLNELLPKSQEEAVAKAAGNQSGSITVTFGALNSSFKLGNINGGVSGVKFGGSERSVFAIQSNIGYLGSTNAPSSGVGRPRSITPPKLDALCEYLLEKPDLYRDETVLFVLDEFNIHATPSSIGRALKSRG